MSTQTRQPILFLSHGAPPLADDAIWTGQLHDWSSRMERPKNILMVSAHWEQAPATVSSFERRNPLVYDFWGFPERYYQVTYDSPLAPDLAMDVAQLVAGPDNPLRHDPSRGLDHGAYVPLVELFPEADIPVLQLSLPTLDPQRLFQLGRALGELREQGTMIIGSGFTTHNLRWFNPSQPADGTPPTVSAEFDHWAAEAVAAGDVDAILDFEKRAPGALEAHPRTEHWAPLYVALGAADATGGIKASSEIDGFWYGLSKRSWQFA
ncbi:MULTISPECIES: dioxygenase family protein [unclassified Luteococcus]|uniref:dioxygenase family protein n=1 Tax=unclassified Luteococcus TaxID=2639923 RepID=UPI00313B30E9